MDNTDLLDGIEAKGKWLLRDAASLVTFMEIAGVSPSFITKAEEAMALAEDSSSMPCASCAIAAALCGQQEACHDCSGHFRRAFRSIPARISGVAGLVAPMPQDQGKALAYHRCASRDGSAGYGLCPSGWQNHYPRHGRLDHLQIGVLMMNDLEGRCAGATDVEGRRAIMHSSVPACAGESVAIFMI